ncbi:MAG: MerR family transcriptional regulator [Ferrovibrio sp.]|uniref:MerR family transcriptional regulator n=1 Tax=Ferrovibrio sp. TaxID=1917215 RepID=UPI0026082FF0|nr:MerR family transcriptional regulator [Ferrovibrio sp.]MCW0233579.1 MerR family transcriptional regulator [Ferrovibrio sp.]
MFRIGEFSRIARVSGRLLRYYDSIGLLSPRYVDPATGYRHYTIDQLGRLNRILALKDLGLTLDQVARLIDEQVSTDEIRGMLLLKKAELEQSLNAEIARLRHIESRLQQIDEQGELKNYDVILKSAPAQPYLSVRRRFNGMDDVVAMLRSVVQAVITQVSPGQRNELIVVAHSDFDDEDLDLDIGFGLTKSFNRAVTLSDQTVMAVTELPAVDALATLIRRGPGEQSHIAFGALGLWMEANGYRIAGPSREVFLELPFQVPAAADAVMEIQFPVRKNTA